MLGIYGICISFASRQIVNLLGANGVHIMPGTSKNKNSENCFFKSVFGVFCYRELFAHSIKYHSLNSYSLLIKD